MLGTLGDVSCRTLAALTAEPRGARHDPTSDGTRESADSDRVCDTHDVVRVLCVYRVRCGQLGVEYAKYEKTTRAVEMHVSHATTYSAHLVP